MPSIRTDLVAPVFKKIQDKTNYGNDGNAWALLTPSVFTQHGVYESDVLKPRSREELRSILKNSGFEMSSNVFDDVWNMAKSMNPRGDVSVEEFRSALNHFETTSNNYESRREETFVS